jgi:hypothetical protein
MVYDPYSLPSWWLLPRAIAQWEIAAHGCYGPSFSYPCVSDCTYHHANPARKYHQSYKSFLLYVLEQIHFYVLDLECQPHHLHFYSFVVRWEHFASVGHRGQQTYSSVPSHASENDFCLCSCWCTVLFLWFIKCCCCSYTRVDPGVTAIVVFLCVIVVVENQSWHATMSVAAIIRVQYKMQRRRFRWRICDLFVCHVTPDVLLRLTPPATSVRDTARASHMLEVRSVKQQQRKAVKQLMLCK